MAMKQWTILFSTAFFLLVRHCSGQIDTNKIKIFALEYNEYIPADESYLYALDNTDTLTIYQEIFEYSFPYIQTTNKDLNKLINDTITKIVGVGMHKTISIEGKNSSPKIKWSWKEISDKPAEHYKNYKVHFISPYFISITINSHSYAGNGGNGSSHGTIALTFDLENKKVLNTSDIFKRQSYPIAYKIFKQQFDSLTESEFASQEKFNRQDSLFWVQNSPFALFNDKIILYTAVYYGHGYYDGEIVYEFEKYKDLFNNEFLITIKKMNW
jgi:hypothetical protein